MSNIRSPKIVERSFIEEMNRKGEGNDCLQSSFEPSYSKISRLSLKHSEEECLSRIKLGGLSSTKSRGLSLSSKIQLRSKKQFEHQNIMLNPENVQESCLLRRKTASTLVKTAHTIHYLGGSLTKSKMDVNLSKAVSKDKNIEKGNLIERCSFITNSSRNQRTQMPKTKSSFSLIKDRHYTVKITPPKPIEVIQQSKKSSQQLKDSKFGKIHQLRKKEFLRSSKKQNQGDKINTIQLKKNKLLNPPSVLKTSQKNLEVITKREFLENFIQKPMVRSIILSEKIESLNDENESPLLRLKKRLELNSINCIYEKQTIISKEIQNNRDQIVEVQESLIFYRNLAQNIRPLTHKMNLFSQGDDKPHKLFLGQEIETNLVFTIKELPLEYFQRFAREIRIYQEIESQRVGTKNILQLIKHSTDSDKHLLLKEPYTETLHDYLENYVSKSMIRLEFEYAVEAILSIIRKMIEKFEEKGLVLKRKFNLNDFVFVFSNLKFQNLEMFELGLRQNLQKGELLESFKQQIESYFHRISCGNLDF